MTRQFAPDLCVIGAGSGGLAVAAGAAQMGAEVVLIERGTMGGDCLNYGCVPSKSLLAAARVANLWRRSAELGIFYMRPRVDFDGTQPKFRQSPPIAPRSTSTTSAPICAAPAATASPPEPAPMTQRSGAKYPVMRASWSASAYNPLGSALG